MLDVEKLTEYELDKVIEMQPILGPKPTKETVEEELKKPNSPLKAAVQNAIAEEEVRKFNITLAIQKITQQILQANQWLLENRLHSHNPAKQQEIEKVQQQVDVLQNRLTKIQDTQQALLLERDEVLKTFDNEWKVLKKTQVNQLSDRLFEDHGMRLNGADKTLLSSVTKFPEILAKSPEIIPLHEGKTEGEKALILAQAQRKADLSFALAFLRVAESHANATPLDKMTSLSARLAQTHSKQFTPQLNEFFKDNRAKDEELYYSQHKRLPALKADLAKVDNKLHSLAQEADGLASDTKRNLEGYQTEAKLTAPKPLSTKLEIPKGQ